MSVINQVLNQLEQRGAHSTAEQTLVRAVVHTRRDFIMPLLAIGLVLIAGIVAWQWVSSRKPDVMAASVVQKQSVAPTVAPASGVSAEAAPTESLMPASRLSLELSSVPLPSTLRQDSGQALRGGSSKPVANPAPVAEPGTNTPVSTARPLPVPATTAKVFAQSSGSAVPMKKISSAQQADAEFRRSAVLMQLGRIDDAIAGYEAALRLDAGHDASRQALVALLLEGKRNSDAEKVLLEGLNIKPENTGLTMLLARLQVERGSIEQATATLEKSLPFADTQADYRAFLAALLQRQNRNEEAIRQYQIVLQHAPGNGVWLMGYGISLQALLRNAEAKDIFQRALDTRTLSPELQAFVQQKLKGL
ncbi:MAG: tetratricopeptide repeat protein [Gallionella sp.]